MDGLINRIVTLKSNHVIIKSEAAAPSIPFSTAASPLAGTQGHRAAGGWGRGSKSAVDGRDSHSVRLMSVSLYRRRTWESQSQVIVLSIEWLEQLITAAKCFLMCSRATLVLTTSHSHWFYGNLAPQSPVAPSHLSSHRGGAQKFR